MKKIIFASLVIIAAVSCKKDLVNNNDLAAATSVQGDNVTTVTLHHNSKIGCMINGSFDNNGRVAQAQKLNVDYVRAGITMSDWNGKSWSYESYVNAGIKVVLNVSYVYTDLNSGVGAPFPKDLTNYKATFQDIVNTYQPPVIVVENEEINKTTHSGPLTDYINMLKVALNVCHPKGIKVTNGGIYGQGLEVLTYRYLQTKGQKRADSFGNECMTTWQIKAAQNPGTNESIEYDVRRLDTLLNFYYNLDYINIHPYEPFDPYVTDASKVTTAAAVVIPDFKEYLIWRTGKPVMTNETGQRDNMNPNLVTSMLQKYDQVDFPYVIWYSGDQGVAGAKPLYDLKTGILYSNGTSFSNFNKTY